MSFNGTKVIHLEKDDFQNNTLVYHGQPVKGTWVVMVQGMYCHFCTNNKPTFAKLAEKFGHRNAHDGIVFATIQVDGGNKEKELAKRLPAITGSQLSGVPAFLKFENGKFAAMVVGGKNEAELIEFAMGR